MNIYEITLKDHPNILKMYEVYKTDKTLYLVTEICEEGELFYYLTKTQHLTELQTAKIMYMNIRLYIEIQNLKISYQNKRMMIHQQNDLARTFRVDEVMTQPKGSLFYMTSKQGSKEASEGEYVQFQIEVRDGWIQREDFLQNKHKIIVQLQVSYEVINIKIHDDAFKGIDRMINAQKMKKRLCYFIQLLLLQKVKLHHYHQQNKQRIFQELLLSLDKDGNGMISLKEMRQVC